jgi:hypothetical protein
MIATSPIRSRPAATSFEERFERTVETKDCKTAFAGHALNPVAALDTVGLGSAICEVT